MPKSLSDKTLSGINWNFFKNSAKAVLNLLVGIVLARILDPKDFGLLGMALVFTGLADLFATLGMGASIIRLKVLEQEHIRAAHILTFFFSIIITSIFWFFAPLISSFYNEPQLVDIIRAISIIFIIKGISTVSYSLLERSFNYKSLMFNDLISFVFGYSLITIILAINGFGVWSLVYGKIASSTIASIQILFKVRPNLKPIFKGRYFKDLVGFGTGVSLNRIVFYAASNVDFLIVGKILDSEALGFYRRSYNTMQIPMRQLNQTVSGVMLAAYSSIQDDIEKIRRTYLQSVELITFIFFPVFTFMIICSEYIIVGLYGEKWRPAILAFQFLTISGFFKVTLNMAGSVGKARGLIYNELWRQIIYLLLLGIGAILGANYGIEGVALAVVLATIWLFISQSHMVLKNIDGSWLGYFMKFIPGIILSLLLLLMNYIMISFLKILNFHNYFEPVLFLLILTNFIFFVIYFVFFPKKIKGNSPLWFFEKYKRRIPKTLYNLFFKFN